MSADLAHPNPNAVWARALEVFGEESKARHWMNGMNAPGDIFDGRSPQELLATGDPTEQRRVLATLIRIDYGVFS